MLVSLCRALLFGPFAVLDALLFAAFILAHISHAGSVASPVSHAGVP
jgi:hypothetical protein